MTGRGILFCSWHGKSWRLSLKSHRADRLLPFPLRGHRVTMIPLMLLVGSLRGDADHECLPCQQTKEPKLLLHCWLPARLPTRQRYGWHRVATTGAAETDRTGNDPVGR